MLQREVPNCCPVQCRDLLLACARRRPQLFTPRPQSRRARSIGRMVALVTGLRVALSYSSASILWGNCVIYKLYQD